MVTLLSKAVVPSRFLTTTLILASGVAALSNTIPFVGKSPFEAKARTPDFITTITNDAWIGTIAENFSLKETLFLLFSISTVLLYPLARSLQSGVDDVAEAEQDYVLAFRLAWRKANRPIQLMGLVEQYIHKQIPYAPWDGSTIRDHWPDKRYLKRLIRAGFVPIALQRGGLRIYQKSKFSVDRFKVKLPVYVQSKGRPHFQFVMLFPQGQPDYPLPPSDRARERFVSHLLSQKEYAVSATFYNIPECNEESDEDVPRISDSPTNEETRLCPKRPNEDHLEVGAESTFKFLLPFKSDFVIRDGKFNRRKNIDGMSKFRLKLDDLIQPNIARTEFPLLYNRTPYAVIRVEAWDEEPAQLDKFVYRIAQSAEVADIWKEDESSRAVGELYDEIGLDYGGYVAARNV